MIRTFKCEIKPTRGQREQFAKAFGTRRWCWNWALATYYEKAREDIFLTDYALDTTLNKLRKENPDEFGWIGEVNSMVKSEALGDFYNSVKAYRQLQKKARRSANPETDKACGKGKPKFKKKGFCEQSFRLLRKNDTAFRIKSKFHFDMNWTRQFGRMNIKTTENIMFLKETKIKTATISSKAGKYYLSLSYEKTNPRKKSGSGTIGVDLGVKHSAVTYDGKSTKTYDLPKTLAKAEKLQSQHQTKLSRKKYGSKNYLKQKRLCDKQSEKQANIRKDFLHKLTSELVNNYVEIKVDDFSFKGAVNLCAKATYKVAPCMLKQMLEYKCEEHGVKLVYVPTFTPTTQTCSECDTRAPERVKLSDRTFSCECGYVADRDENAARNVFKLVI